MANVSLWRLYACILLMNGAVGWLWLFICDWGISMALPSCLSYMSPPHCLPFVSLIGL
ncbi:hypothetical protein BDW69DRAFT_163806 [Aspergillus filifer]